MAYEVFISYSHRDKALRNELDKHLANLKRQKVIASWYDGDISPGTEWEPQIIEHLKRAQIILLLVSADFMASDFCYSIEMTQAIARHDANQARVIPILLRPTAWKGAPFAKLQALPSEGKAVTSWANQDEAFVNIAEGIQRVVEELAATIPVGVAQVSTWNVPYTRNALFTGREDVLTQLYEALRAGKTTASSQPQAISGLGGIGKTQTAMEYAYRYRDDYDYVLWVKAESREALISDFVTIAHLLNLPEQQEQEQRRIVEAVKRWFQEHSGWLLICDNADDLRIVQDFLPSGGKGHILLTTRAQAMGRIAERIELEQMDPDEGALFLLHRATILGPDAPLDAASKADHEAAREISIAMDGLPLALDQAGAFIEETQSGLSDYLQFYHTRQDELLRRRGRLVTDHPDPVATTWSLSFEKVQQANPAAAELLRLFAFLDADVIQEEIITQGATELGSALHPVATDPIKLNEAMGALLAYSLVRRNSDHTLTVHRLVQAVLKHGMNKSTQRRWAERAVRAVNLAFPEVKYENWLACQRYIQNVLACAALIEEWSMGFPEAAQLFNSAGDYLAESAQYEQAGPLLQRALAIRERVLGPQHPSTAVSLFNLASLYDAQGKYEQAEPLYQRALMIRERVLGPEHRNTATSLNNLALLYQDHGKYEQAEPLLRRVRAIHERGQEA
jgi:tetratricopeptide (TPR) repeat protein